MENLKHIPFFRLLVPFVLGIGFAFTLCSAQLNSFSIYIALSTFVLLAISLSISSIWSLRWLFGCFCFLFFLIAGIVITLHHQRPSRIESNTEADAIVMLLERPEPRANTYRAVSKVICIRQDEGPWRMVNQKVMLYFRSNDSLASNLEYGSTLALHTRFSPTPMAVNPYQFDYAKYLAKRGIYQTCFVSLGEWMEIYRGGSKILAFSFKLREMLINLFQRAGLEGENLGVASALTMGYKSLLDDETRRVFSASGAMHILAVSGLHVGILFFIASTMLFFLGKRPLGRVLRAILIIIFLWFYALFTGLSPSVLRASLMFSFIVIGGALSRKTNIYNTICASAFLLLCFNPLLITEIGFQLSYLAVLSIVFFYPHIYKLIYVHNRWLDKVWSLVAVSIAAQIGTFSISLFYFQQFPNYFLLTNLYAIPLATIIIYASLALIIFSPLWIIGEWLGVTLDSCLTALNSLTRFTEALPHSITGGISMSTIQLILLLASILLFSIYLHTRRGYLLALVLGMFCILIINKNLVASGRMEQSQMVVFSLRGHTAIGFMQGKEMVLVHSDTTAVDPFKAHSFNLQGYVNRFGIRNPLHFSELPTEYSQLLPTLSTTPSQFGNWFSFSGLTVFQPKGTSLANYRTDSQLPIDILIVSNRMKQRPEPLLSLVRPELVIIDSSVPEYRARQMAAIINNLGYRVHVVATQGAFVWGINI